MIISMKRLELLLYYKERDIFLESLRSIGVVHLIESEAAAEAAELVQLSTLVKRCDHIVKKLGKSNASKGITSQAPEQTEVIGVIEKFELLEKQYEQCIQELQNLKKEQERLKPWGAFDSTKIKKLQDAGVILRFYTAPVKQFTALKDDPDTIIVRINEAAGQVHFLAIAYKNEITINAQESTFFENSSDEIELKIKNCIVRQQEYASAIEGMYPNISLVDTFRIECENQIRYKRAHLSMVDHTGGKIVHLSGWFPVDQEVAIRKFLNNYSAWYSIRNPLPDEDVPVKLKNKPFSKLFEPITGLYSLPHHTELDITPFMAPFFSIFFGLCLGDVGYGLVLLICAILIFVKGGSKIKPFAMLGIVLSSSTIISGVLLNSFFGMAIFGGTGVEQSFLSSGVEVFSPLASSSNDNGNTFPAMGLALVLGVVQILFGMILQTIIRARNCGIIAGIQPVASMAMVTGGIAWAAHANLLNLNIGEFTVGPVLIGTMILNCPLSLAKILTIGGLTAFLFFNNIDKKIFIRPATGLWEFYQFATGILGDVLSYLRLFALGLAGGLLGAAFNQIAFMFITKDGVINYGSPGIIATILILIAGHGLNLCLSIIGSFVHPLRLTFVEFYKNIGFRGGSKPYIPFTKLELEVKS